MAKKIYVTYVGADSFVVHRARSRKAKSVPYKFVQGLPLKIDEPEDVGFFWKNRDKFQHFLVTSKKPKESDIEQVGAEDQNQKKQEKTPEVV